MEKRCSVCEEEVGKGLIQCPRCGCGVFESDGIRYIRREVTGSINT
jgi:hypothetical protein